VDATSNVPHKENNFAFLCPLLAQLHQMKTVHRLYTVYPKLTWKNMKTVKDEETKLVCLEWFWQKQALQLPAKGKKSTCEGIQGEQSYSSTCSKFDTRCR
jgi:hypothetical protein